MKNYALNNISNFIFSRFSRFSIKFQLNCFMYLKLLYDLQHQPHACPNTTPFLPQHHPMLAPTLPRACSNTTPCLPLHHPMLAPTPPPCLPKHHPMPASTPPHACPNTTPCLPLHHSVLAPTLPRACSNTTPCLPLHHPMLAPTPPCASPNTIPCLPQHSLIKLCKEKFWETFPVKYKHGKHFLRLLRVDFEAMYLSCCDTVSRNVQKI